LCLPDADYYIVRPGCCQEIELALEPVRGGVSRRSDE
jgi:hypothetical protein